MSDSMQSCASIDPRRPGFRLRTWLLALRIESFPVSVIPAILGTATAWQEGYRIDMRLALLTVFGALAVHIATNLLQDYFDFKSGLDRAGTMGGSGVLVSGDLAPRSVLIASSAFFAASAAVAGYMIYACGPALAWIVAAGLVLGAGYALPRYGLKYIHLGDVGVFLAFGVGITAGSYFVQTGRLSWYPLCYAVPFGLLVVALLHSNNMRDARDDFEAGLRNTACMMGPRVSRAFYALLIGGAYASVVVFVLLGAVPRGAVVVLVTLPWALKLVGRSVWSDPSDSSIMGTQVAYTALLSLVFGSALVLGISVFEAAGR